MKTPDGSAVIMPPTDTKGLSAGEWDALAKVAGAGLEELPPDRIPLLMIVQEKTKGRTDDKSPMYGVKAGMLWDMATNNPMQKCEVVPYMLTRRYVVRPIDGPNKGKVIEVTPDRPADAKWIEGMGLRNRAGHSVSADYSLYCLLINGGKSDGPRIIRLGRGQSREGKALAEALNTPVPTPKYPKGMKLPVFCRVVQIDTLLVEKQGNSWFAYAFAIRPAPLAVSHQLFIEGHKAYVTYNTNPKHPSTDDAESDTGTDGDDIPY